MNIRTSSRQVILEVEKIRLLGLLIEKHKTNRETINRLTTKVSAAACLVNRVAYRKACMRDGSLLRLVHSFAMGHVPYVTAFHNWQLEERNKVNAMIRNAHKAALGLLDCRITKKLQEFIAHSTLKEIEEAHRATQLERLAETKTGRAILERLGVDTDSSKDGYSRTGEIQDQIRRTMRSYPFPKNMSPEHNRERTTARAKALVELHADLPGTNYFDAVEYRLID